MIKNILLKKGLFSGIIKYFTSSFLININKSTGIYNCNRWSIPFCKHEVKEKSLNKTFANHHIPQLFRNRMKQKAMDESSACTVRFTGSA